jgi:hypothetical protein
MNTISVSDKENAAIWEKLKRGSIIVLSDPQSIEKSVQEGQKGRGLNYTIKELDIHRHIVEGEISGICDWIFAKLDRQADDMDLYLMVKKVDGADPEFRLYYRPTIMDENGSVNFTVPNGNRRDLLNLGHGWVFDIENTEDILDKDLMKRNFSQSIYYSTADGQVVYHKKEMGEQFAKTTCVGSSKVGPLLSTIVEYKAPENSSDNPDALFIETGNVNNNQGGFISFYLGSEIGIADVEIIRF